jgi:L-ribulokinase
VAPKADLSDKFVRGICGQVDGSVIPGMIGLEAGQSAFGDTYAWFRNVLAWPLQNLLKNSSLIEPSLAEKLVAEMMQEMIPALSAKAAQLPLDEDAVIAVDWLNGRRTPDANQELKGAIRGLNLGTDAVHIFRAWVEGTCFGARAIVDRFRTEGVPVKGLIGLGGVARKSPFIMQTMANVMNMPIRIHRSEQTCALGAAMFAATAAGIFKNVETAMNEMGQGFDAEYKPEPANVPVYAKRYKKYLSFGSLLEKGATVGENLVHQTL